MCVVDPTYLAGMVSLEAVDLSPVFPVHLLKFIEVAFRLGDMLNGDIVSFGRHRKLGRFVGHCAANGGRNWSSTARRNFQARLLHFGHLCSW